MRGVLRVVPLMLLVASCALFFSARGGDTVPLFAARTGLACQTCHFDPNGGGPRNEFGFNFAKQRHTLEPEDSTSQWASLELANRVSETVPIYFGINHRLMLLDNTSFKSDSLDRLAFFNMENAFHITVQPHPRLTLVYTRDGLDGGSKSQDAFGMIGGFPWNGYLKAGRFRTPFGLRMDDHTVGTRNSFLDLIPFYVPFTYAGDVRPSFLPYDPREPDMGVEVGLEDRGYFSRVAWTNGASHPFSFDATKAQAITAKLGYVHPQYHGGVSFYDDWHKEAISFGPTVLGHERSTRYGYYGMTHYGPFALLGEVAAGQDRDVDGSEHDVLASFIELNYTPTRWANLRLRFDRAELDRGTDDEGYSVSNLNTHTRYAIEGEFLPVPFAELRWVWRHIDHELDDFPTGEELPNENQGYFQFHFSY